MAQVIDHYTSQVAGGATNYYYSRADTSSSATRIYNDAWINICATASGDPEFTVSPQGIDMYHIYSPGGGYISRGIVYYPLTAVYRTVTDKLGIPLASIAPSGTLPATLTISGAVNGDQNIHTAYEYEYQETTRNGDWPDAWTAGGTVSAAAGETKTVSVTCASTNKRRYRVRSQGTAGAAYFSDWQIASGIAYVEETGQIGGCSILAPLSGSTIISKAPNENAGNLLFGFYYGTCTLSTAVYYLSQYQLDGGEWTEFISGEHFSAAGGTVFKRLHLASGVHTLSVRMVALKTDGTWGSGHTAAISFTVSVRSYVRSIAAGSVISSTSISHKAELEQLLSLVNTAAAGLGLSAISFSQTCGRFASWKSNVQELLYRLQEIRGAYNAPAGTFTVEPPVGALPSYPTASVINCIRSMLDEF